MPFKAPRQFWSDRRRAQPAATKPPVPDLLLSTTEPGARPRRLLPLAVGMAFCLGLLAALTLGVSIWLKSMTDPTRLGLRWLAQGLAVLGMMTALLAAARARRGDQLERRLAAVALVMSAAVAAVGIGLAA